MRGEYATGESFRMRVEVRGDTFTLKVPCKLCTESSSCLRSEAESTGCCPCQINGEERGVCQDQALTKGRFGFFTHDTAARWERPALHTHTVSPSTPLLLLTTAS